MAEYYRPEVKVGCFVVLSTVIFATFLVWISGGTSLFRQWFETRSDYHVRFADATGIKIGSSIRVAGATVGEVTGMTRRGTQMEITCSIDSAVEVFSNCEFSIQPISFLGGSFINLNPGSPEGGAVLISPVVDDTKELTSRKEAWRSELSGTESSNMNILIEQGTEFLDEATGVMAEFRVHQTEMMENLQRNLAAVAEISEQTQLFLGENRKRLDAIVVNAEQISAEIRRFLSQNQEHLDGTVEEVHGLIGDTRENLNARSEELGRIMTTVERDLLTRLSDLTTNLANLSQHMDQVVLDNDRNLREIVLNMRETSQNLTELTNRLRADPSLLIFGSDEDLTEMERQTLDERALRDSGRPPLEGRRQQ